MVMRRSRPFRLPLYLIPIMVGMAGVLFSRELPDPRLKWSVLAGSVLVPLFASGHLMAQLQGRMRERISVLAGILLLIVGAAASVSGFSQTLVEQQLMPERVSELSRWIGIASLLMGLLVTVFWVVRSGEAFEEIAGRFRNLIEQMNEGVVVSGINGDIVLYNQRFIEISGLPKEKVAGQTVESLATELRLDPIIWHWKQRARGVASEYEITYNRGGDERRLLICGNPIYDRHGHNAGTMATIRDITEQYRMGKRIERYTHGLQKLVEEQTQKLRTSERRFRDLLVHMSEGFLAIDGAFKIRFCNDRILDMLQIPTDTLTGRNVFEFVDPRGRTRLLDALETAETERPMRLQQELRLMRADGTMVPVMAAIAPIPLEGEDGMRFSLVATDVSDLKRMQYQLEERARELERVNEELRAHGRAKDSFLSNVSHELRTPLSTIQGYVEMLASASLGPLEGPQKGAVDVMARNVDRLGGLINEMIEFSRMEIRGVQVKLKLFRVDKLVKEAVASIRPQVLAKDISLSTHIEDGLGPIWGDREKIGQVLGILLSNAVKFSSNGAMVQVRVLQRADGTAEFSVADTGIGIARAHQERIFSKFFQVDSSLTRRYEGTGIGLSIAKSIAAAHGGAIELQSEPGKGSTFTLVLPGAVFDTRIERSAKDGLTGVKVLIVDDGNEARKAIGTLLEGCGIEIFEVRTGYEGVRIAEDEHPSVILSDEVMPDITAVTLVGRLRENPATDGLPVVVLTQGASSDFDREGGKPDHVDLLRKPFSGEALVAAVKRALGHEIDVTYTSPPPETATVQSTRAAVQSAGPVVLLLGADEDLMEWVGTALHHRNMSTVHVAEPEEARAAVANETVMAAFVDVESSTSSLARVVSQLRATPGLETVPIHALAGTNAIQQGVDGLTGCLLKPFTVRELLNAVLAAAGKAG